MAERGGGAGDGEPDSLLITQAQPSFQHGDGPVEISPAQAHVSHAEERMSQAVWVIDRLRQLHGLRASVLGLAELTHLGEAKDEESARGHRGKAGQAQSLAFIVPLESRDVAPQRIGAAGVRASGIVSWPSTDVAVTCRPKSPCATASERARAASATARAG